MGPHDHKPWEVMELESLTFHWGDAYRIGNPLPGRWIAQRRDDGEPMTAGSAEELHNLILADYKERPVPRECT